MHPGVVVEVEVVVVEVLVVVVVVCAWQLPPEQFPLQHWAFLAQVFPLRLQPGGSADASPMPTDPSAPPTKGSTHQPERLTSRNAAIGQSSGQIVEEAIFSGHRKHPPRKTGLLSPAELRNEGKYEGLHSLAQLPTCLTPAEKAVWAKLGG
jgi:hypothetical protein